MERKLKTTTVKVIPTWHESTKVLKEFEKQNAIWKRDEEFVNKKLEEFSSCVLSPRTGKTCVEAELPDVYHCGHCHLKKAKQDLS